MKSLSEMKMSTTSRIPHETIEDAFYDTINEVFYKEYPKLRHKPQTLIKRMTRDLKNWHDKMMGKHKKREWYVRITPNVEFRKVDNTFLAYARYQFADKDVIIRGNEQGAIILP